MMTNANLRSAALQACCLAGISSRETNGVTFDPRGLPVELQKPAMALMYAALSHVLASAFGTNPCLLRWAGHTWCLTLWSEGRVHISPAAGGVGLLACHCLCVRSNPCSS